MTNTKKVCLALILICLSISCTTEQIQRVTSRIKEGLPGILGSIAYAYGGQYAGLMGKFVNVISGTDIDFEGMYAENIPEDEGYYYEDQDYYYEDQDYYYEDQQQDERYYYEEQRQDQANYQVTGDQEKYIAEPQRLEVSIDVVKETFINGRFEARSVNNGDVLTQQDNYKVLFQSNMPCYMYIAQLDATGKLDPILPSLYVPFGNPIQSPRLYDIPSGTNWFYLDANRGIETIYFIASRSPRPDIEQIFAEFEGVNQSLEQLNPISMKTVHVVTRGIAGTRPGSSQPVSFQNGSEGQYLSTIFESIQTDFVMTRWFYHQ